MYGLAFVRSRTVNRIFIIVPGVIKSTVVKVKGELDNAVYGPQESGNCMHAIPGAILLLLTNRHGVTYVFAFM